MSLLTRFIVRDGILLLLPRFSGRRFRVPDGYVDLWQVLSKRVNCKRMFGVSLKTMFITGHFTSDALKEALTERNGGAPQDSDEHLHDG